MGLKEQIFLNMGTLSWQILVMLHARRDYDGKVTPEEVASATMYLKDTLGKEGVQELISNLSKDGGQFLFLSLNL